MLPLAITLPSGRVARAVAFAWEKSKYYYDPDQPRAPVGSEDGGQWTVIGVGQAFADAPLDKKGAKAWLKKIQKRYDSDSEFRAAVDAAMLFTQGDYSVMRAMAVQEIAGVLPQRYLDSALPKWRDEKMFGNPLAKYKAFLTGQPFLDDENSRASWGEGARALNNAVRTSKPLAGPIYRGIYGRDNMDKLFAMKPGETFDVIGPTSFTLDRELAVKFSVGKASGQGGGGLAHSVRSAVVEVASGARGIPVAALSPWNQSEVISSGRFRIKSIEEGEGVSTGKSRGWTKVSKVRRVIVEQVDTFRNTKL